jgi:lipopolysaccharide/colanic/teichoic acid biosynthesis glycosyltransferase
MYVDARERFPELYGYEYTPDQVARLQFKLPQDPRLTRLGTVLRRTTLDELPNFINLVRGDVTLVGPRPEIPEMVKHYRREQRRKFEVKPGITGMAQADGRGLLSFQETLNKDLEYVEKRSLSLDVRIILNTIQVTLLRVGAF